MKHEREMKVKYKVDYSDWWVTMRHWLTVTTLWKSRRKTWLPIWASFQQATLFALGEVFGGTKLAKY